MTPTVPDVESLTMSQLREARLRDRRALELAILRHRGSGEALPDDVAELRARVDAVTAELIRRYSADLSLVDSLLDPAYPANQGGGS